MEPFKNLYNRDSLSKFALEIKKAHDALNTKSFITSLFPQIEKLEMKDRVRLISTKLWDELDMTYPKAIKILMKSVSTEGNNGFIIWPISQFIEMYGLNHYRTSMDAIKKLTVHFTGEFCLRPFIEVHEEKVFEDMHKWKLSKNHHIRRLVSEGTRPNLPWGVKLTTVNNNLDRNIELISSLRSDPSEYVRRSVANHLNDISRLDKSLFFKTINSFSEQSSEVQRVIRHSSRTLLKAGDKKALKLHGYTLPKKIEAKVVIHKKSVKEGEYLPLTVILDNQFSKDQKILIDYIIRYVKNGEKHSDKVFRLRDTVILSKSKLKIDKKISFKPVTTRKHYPGKHFLSLQINGKIFCTKEFKLIL